MSTLCGYMVGNPRSTYRLPGLCGIGIGMDSIVTVVAYVVFMT
jgi:hypothetical protein